MLRVARTMLRPAGARTFVAQRSNCSGSSLSRIAASHAAAALSARRSSSSKTRNPIAAMPFSSRRCTLCTTARARSAPLALTRIPTRLIHGRATGPGGNPFSGGGGGGGFGAGTPFGVGGMGPGGPIQPWKVLAVAGGLVVMTVSGVVLIGSLLGPIGLGALGAWWLWRRFRRFRSDYEAMGGAANPANPFRHGPFTPEAREAAKVLRVQKQMGAMFRTFARAAGVNPNVAGMDMGMGGMGAAAAAAVATEAEMSTTFESFLVRKTRATLLEQALRHPALYALQAAVTSAASTAKPRISAVSSSVREVATRTGGLELQADETLELSPPIGAAAGAGAAAGRGTLRARFTLRLSPELVQSLQGELDHWRRAAAAALSAQSQSQSQSQSSAELGVVVAALPDPDPFDGRLFPCVTFESVTFTPHHSRRSVDLTADPAFKDGRARSGAAIVQEAEFEEIQPTNKRR